MGSRDHVTVDVADAAQQLVQMLLWEEGLDPTWPPCPEHCGRHPLRARYLSTIAMSNGLPVLSGSDARWECPDGMTSTSIGELDPLTR